jgi:hypothetical protein
MCTLLALTGCGGGNKTKATTQSKSVTASTTRSVYTGPFGIDMGLNLSQVKEVCKTKHLDEDAYEITPPKKSDLFETYIVWIDSDYGIYGIRAIGKEIHTDSYGSELKETFESLVKSIEKKYGKYKKTDRSDLDAPEIFMLTLLNGARELSAIWATKHKSNLPSDIAGIRIDAIADTFAIISNTGHVTLEYFFSNAAAVKARADSVF